MNEQHTIYATLRIGDRELEEIPLKVNANYCPGWPGNRVDPPEAEGYEIWSVELGELSTAQNDALQETLEQYLLDDLDGKQAERVEEERESRYDMMRERFPGLQENFEGVMGLSVRKPA